MSFSILKWKNSLKKLDFLTFFKSVFWKDLFHVQKIVYQETYFLL